MYVCMYVYMYIAFHNAGRQPQPQHFQSLLSGLPNDPPVHLYSTPVLPLACQGHSFSETLLPTHSTDALSICVTLSTFLLQAQVQPSLVRPQQHPGHSVISPVAILSTKPPLPVIPPALSGQPPQMAETTMSCLLPFPLWQCCWWWS